MQRDKISPDTRVNLKEAARPNDRSLDNKTPLSSNKRDDGPSRMSDRSQLSNTGKTITPEDIGLISQQQTPLN